MIQIVLDEAEEASLEALEGDGIRGDALDTLLETVTPVISLWKSWRLTFGSPIQLRKNWNEAQVAWDFLQQYVRARLLEVGHPWLLADTSRAINEFFDRDIPGEITDIEVSVRAFLQVANQIGDPPRQGLGQGFESRWSPGPRERIDLNIPTELIEEMGSAPHFINEGNYWDHLEALYSKIEPMRHLTESLSDFGKLAEEVHDSLSLGLALIKGQTPS